MRSVLRLLPAFAALLLLYGATVSALTVHLKHPADIDARLRRVDAEEAVREIRLRGGAATNVDLPGGTWEITTASDDVWTAPVYAAATDVVTLQGWPRAEIAGTVGSGPAAGDLALHFSNDVVSGVSTCELKERKWRCSMPAGSFDLRFSLAGHANEFRWGVAIPADLKEIDFTAGSALSGFVEGARNVEVIVAQQAKTFKARPNARGFFQVKGLAPGQYTVRATAKELVSEMRTIQIIGHTNASLKDPLVLAKPATLTLTLMPQLDPHNQPWQVELWRNRDEERWLIADRRVFRCHRATGRREVADPHHDRNDAAHGEGCRKSR